MAQLFALASGASLVLPHMAWWIVDPPTIRGNVGRQEYCLRQLPQHAVRA